jgi:Swt1-like HEPN
MARANSGVMAEFRKKANITNQAIALRSKKLQELVRMPREIATYVAASRAGVAIDKHLDTETLREVADYDVRVHAKEQSTGRVTAAAPAKRGTAKKAAASEIRLPNLNIPPGTLSDQQFKNAQRMAGRVYPLLYAFENSVREFVNGHLTATYGKDWWDRPNLVGSDTRKNVEKTRRAEGSYRWVERRTAHRIYYTMLGDLADIITSNEGWKVFKSIFNRQAWVEDRVASVEVPRNVVAHMNPLLEKNIKGLEVRAQEWFDQIKDHLPPST